MRSPARRLSPDVMGCSDPRLEASAPVRPSDREMDPGDRGGVAVSRTVSAKSIRMTRVTVRIRVRTVKHSYLGADAPPPLLGCLGYH